MDPSPSSQSSILDRLTALLLREPKDREQLTLILRGAFEHHLMDADALSIIEGALAVSDMSVRDIMVPRAQVDVININDPPEKIVESVIEATHSRFPAIGEDRDDVLGILLAKDLLRCVAGKEFDLRDALRPAVFVPEAKRLNVLLREFRASRNHMAIVVDEYGGVAGLVTIEDVLEQIVGEIEDEFDFDETEANIVPDNNGRFRVKAATEIADFNEEFKTALTDEHYDTIGGAVIHALGRLPKRNEVLTIEGLRVQVLRTDSRRVHTLLVDPQKTQPSTSEAPAE
jgi:magnesium and cobalt transporter